MGQGRAEKEIIGMQIPREGKGGSVQGAWAGSAQLLPSPLEAMACDVQSGPQNTIHSGRHMHSLAQ